MHLKMRTSQRMRKSGMSKSHVKAMMIVFIYIRVIIVIELVHEGHMVNENYCLEVLTKYRK